MLEFDCFNRLYSLLKYYMYIHIFIGVFLHTYMYINVIVVKNTL